MLVEQLAFLAWALPVASLVNPRLIKPNYFTISAVSDILVETVESAGNMLANISTSVLLVVRAT